MATTNGTIKRITDRGFGFITTPEGAEYFFHQSACAGTRFDELREGQMVSFTGSRVRKAPAPRTSTCGNGAAHTIAPAQPTPCPSFAITPVLTRRTGLPCVEGPDGNQIKQTRGAEAHCRIRTIGEHVLGRSELASSPMNQSIDGFAEAHLVEFPSVIQNECRCHLAHVPRCTSAGATPLGEI